MANTFAPSSVPRRTLRAPNSCLYVASFQSVTRPKISPPLARPSVNTSRTVALSPEHTFAFLLSHLPPQHHKSARSYLPSPSPLYNAHPYLPTPSPPRTSTFALPVMTTKRTAADATHPTSPPSSAKRQRSQNGLPRPANSPLPATPARPPRMPRFDHDHATATADKKLVNRLNRLTAQELLTLVKDVELRFRQLAAFESEEIRRAQKLGFTRANSPLKVMMQTTAW